MPHYTDDIIIQFADALNGRIYFSTHYMTCYRSADDHATPSSIYRLGPRSPYSVVHRTSIGSNLSIRTIRIITPRAWLASPYRHGFGRCKPAPLAHHLKCNVQRTQQCNASVEVSMCADTAVQVTVNLMTASMKATSHLEVHYKKDEETC